MSLYHCEKVTTKEFIKGGCCYYLMRTRKNLLGLGKVLTIFLVLTLSLVGVLANSYQDKSPLILEITNPINHNIYSENLTSFEFYINANPAYISTLSCYYILNNVAENAIPCEYNNNYRSGIHTLEGKNILEVFVTDSNGNSASDKVTFEINSPAISEENHNCNSITNNLEDDELEQFYLQQALEDGQKRKIIYLNNSVEEEKDLTLWQRFVNWFGRIFGMAPAY